MHVPRFSEPSCPEGGHRWIICALVLIGAQLPHLFVDSFVPLFHFVRDVKLSSPVQQVGFETIGDLKGSDCRHSRNDE